MHRQLLALAAALTVVVPRSSAAAQGTDVYRLVIGTWELNVAKSHLSGDAPKSLTRTYEASGDGVKYTDKTVDAEGKPVVDFEFTGKYDGKDYPVTFLGPGFTQAMKATDPFRSSFIVKKDGKVVVSGTRVISRDGRIMTIREKETDAKGQTTNTVLVFERVGTGH